MDAEASADGVGREEYRNCTEIEEVEIPENISKPAAGVVGGVDAGSAVGIGSGHCAFLVYRMD